ncbi:MAG: hypothetical protein ACM3N0_02520, partial [Chloroflexota bacterium]
RVSSSGAPDAPVTKVIVDQQGGQKGLFVNSTDLCAGVHRASAELAAHNGRAAKLHPALRATKCRNHNKKRHASHRHKGGKGKKS